MQAITNMKLVASRKDGIAAVERGKRERQAMQRNSYAIAKKRFSAALKTVWPSAKRHPQTAAALLSLLAMACATGYFLFWLGARTANIEPTISSPVVKQVSQAAMVQNPDSESVGLQLSMSLLSTSTLSIKD